ncbi:MAG: ATP-binding cassette domain-containing protein [Nitrospirae bacterium]|nr:ATP-binding cassette domain-containing protein [Nitrospirota bacterium]
MSLSVDISKELNGFILDVKWEIGREIGVLFGFSGSGKSLTLKAISGLMTPDEGSIISNGVVLFDSSANISIPVQQRSFGYVFQTLALFPHMKVKDNIGFGAKEKDKRQIRGKVHDLIKLFHLEGLQDKYPSEISGGQKQRVAFARALIGNPSTLLLDEPFSALDNPLRHEMGQLLLYIRKEFDIPIVLVTHDIFEAYTLADKLIVYSNGQIALVGKPSEILKQPVTPELEALLNVKAFVQRLSHLTP